MEKPKSRGIVIQGGSGNIVERNRIIGFNEGIVMDEGKDNRAKGNVVLSADVAALFQNIEVALTGSKLKDQDKNVAIVALQAMKSEVGSPAFLSRYKEFMSIIADHMQVLGPVLSQWLPPLAGVV